MQTERANLEMMHFYHKQQTTSRRTGRGLEFIQFEATCGRLVEDCKQIIQAQVGLILAYFVEKYAQ